MLERRAYRAPSLDRLGMRLRREKNVGNDTSEWKIELSRDSQRFRSPMRKAHRQFARPARAVVGERRETLTCLPLAMIAHRLNRRLRRRQQLLRAPD